MLNNKDKQVVDLLQIACRYYNILRKHGGPNAEAAKQFYSLYKNNTAVADRLNVLNDLWKSHKIL